MLVQSELPHSHTEYVHFEPSPVMVSLGRIKDFHVVRADSAETILNSEFTGWVQQMQSAMAKIYELKPTVA